MANNDRRVHSGASMGPRQKSLGNNTLWPITILTNLASMGPRQKSLGNVVESSRSWPKLKLQWGRGKKASEI